MNDKNSQLILKLQQEMIAFDNWDPKRVQHVVKVHALSSLIGRLEGLPEEVQMTLETGALIHDIGIHTCLEKYGNCNGKHQEEEGPALGREVLTRLGFEEPVIERACYLCGHHHTYTGIDGLDYRILVEADFLVNLFEDHEEKETIRKVYENIFRTESGKRICRMMYALD